MEITLPYGHETRTLRMPDGTNVHYLKSSDVSPLDDLSAEIRQGLANPLGGRRIADLLRPNTVAIAVPDETRPTPVREILHVLLDEIFGIWPDLPRKNVSIIVGGGLHEPASADSMARIAPPESTLGCRVLAHDARNSAMADLGITSRGTPVHINAHYAAADLRIVVGQIDPHQFMGFTGGSKGVTVGLASPETIRHSHSLMLRDEARAGLLWENPAREDVSEAGRMVGIHLAVNVVLNAAKLPVWVGVGDPDAVLERGAGVCSAVYGVRIDNPYDLVLASCGGYPKDICLYQAQKGLNMASQAARSGGRVLLLAECGQGVGDDDYYSYVCRFENMDQAMDDFRKIGFRMGAHKAFLFGRSLARCEVVVDSELDPEILRRCHLTPGKAQPTLDRWISMLPPGGRVAVIPNANTTYFTFSRHGGPNGHGIHQQ
ncbi:MAG: nickel-dependent lactate racemase [Desulfocurvibacter africanus]